MSFELEILPISEVQIGDIIYTNDLVDDWYSFVVKCIDNETEGGSDKWGRVFYDHKNNFTTEKAIAKRWGILGNSEERQGFAIRVVDINNDGVMKLNDNPLDEIYVSDTISKLREDRNYWYNQAQELNKALMKQDKIIDDYRKQLKEEKKQMLVR